jgi:hypothetical protein
MASILFVRFTGILAERRAGPPGISFLQTGWRRRPSRYGVGSPSGRSHHQAPLNAAALTTFVTLYARENSGRRDGDRPARAAWAAQRLLVDVVIPF